MTKENKNKVVLDLDTYNYLRDFERQIREENGIYLDISPLNFITNYFLVTKEKALVDLTKKIDELSVKLTKCQENNEKLAENKFKNMSIYEFIKWRKHNKNNA